MKEKNLLKIYMETTEEGKKKKIFESNNVELIINWTIIALYDGAIKRCKIKIDQYYGEDGKQYCKIKATYKILDSEYNEIKETYVIENWSNEWGNFINVIKTFKNNNVEIKGDK